MRRLLFLSYHWPPIGGAHTQRPISLAEYFVKFGYEPVVITGPESAGSSRWTPTDESLEARLTYDVETHRIAVPEPRPAGRWEERADRWLGRRSRWADWWINGVVDLGRRVAKEADLIYASMQPYESAEAAARLSTLLRRPWVGDLTDPWALDEMMIYPTAAHRRFELRRMRRALRTAGGIAMSTAEATERLLVRLPELNGKPVIPVSNGYWGPDFEGAAPLRSDSMFRIVHTGYLHTALGYRHQRFRAIRRLLGGALHNVDVLTRSHVYLLQAIDRLIEEQPDAASRIELVLAGVLSDADRAAVAGRKYVRLLGYCDHTDTVRLVRSADLLFLPMHDLPPGVRATIVPGKTYEYLASGRPILAAVPDGDARDILNAAGGVWLCRPADVIEMKRALRTLYDAFSARGGQLQPRDMEIVRRYDYRVLAERLTQLFDSVVSETDARNTGRSELQAVASES